MITKLITQQLAGTAFMAIALPLTIVHPLIHHLENGTLDTILDYAYAATINAMNATNRTTD